MFWYLATPYSKYAGGIDAAFEEASRQAALLLRAGAIDDRLAQRARPKVSA